VLVRVRRTVAHLVGQPRDWLSSGSAPAAVDERVQERKLVGEVFQHAFEIPFQACDARP
jgi:hypothetical protein